MRLIIFVICFLFSGSVISQTKLSQLERSSNKWDVPIAYRTVNGTYAQGYLSFLNFIDSINYNAVRVLIPGYGIDGLITNDTMALWADTTEVQRKLTLTTSGTSGAATLVGGTLNIPNYSVGGTDLSFSGAASPYTLNSSTGTDVTFTAGTGIGLSATSGNITISNTGSGGSLPSGSQNQTLRHNGSTWVANSAVQIINVGGSTERAQIGSTTFPLGLNAGTGTSGTRLAVSGGIQFVPSISTSTGIAGMDINNGLTRITIGQGLTLTGNTLTASNGNTLYAYLGLSSTNNTTTVDAKFNFTAQSTGPPGSPTASSLNDNFTVQTAGTYEVTFNANMKAASVASAHNVYIRINSSNQLFTKRTIVATQYGSVSSSFIQGLNVGDVIDVWIDLTSTTVQYDSGFLRIKKIN